MPIYEYFCPKCDAAFEVSQKISDKPIRSCPTCKSKVKKIISQTAFQLKGTGWYKTDYTPTAPKTTEPKKTDEKK